ncbi:unnamed protein product [Durusdinium trenchii]
MDMARLVTDHAVPCATMMLCIDYCNTHQVCRGFTCSWHVGACYIAIDYTPAFSKTGHKLVPESTTPLPAKWRTMSSQFHQRSYIKWAWPSQEERDRAGYYQIYFFLHHKGRSSMTLEVVRQIAAHLRLSLDLMQSVHRPDELQCARADIGVFFVTPPQVVAFLDRHCQPYRAVHILRDPLDLLTSAFAYHRSMELPVNDTIPGSQPAVLRRLSVRRGLLVEAYAELGHTLHHMLQVQIQVRERAYCLSLFGEDLVENFDATLQRILKHLVPGLSWRRQITLKAAAAQLDGRRCGSPTLSDTRLQPRGHQSLKARAKKAVGLLKKQTPPMKEILDIRRLLGYDNRVVGPSRSQTRRAGDYGVIDGFSGAIFGTNASLLQARKCWEWNGHYLLFDLGMADRTTKSMRWSTRELLKLFSSKWLTALLNLTLAGELVGICVNFDLNCCEVQASWDFLARFLSDLLDSPQRAALPPPSTARIRSRLCSQPAFEALASLRQSLPTWLAELSLPALQEELLRMGSHPESTLLKTVRTARASSSREFEFNIQDYLGNSSSFWD